MVEPTFKVKEENLRDDYGEFVFEPLEPGYGHTMGEALRRDKTGSCNHLCAAGYLDP